MFRSAAGAPMKPTVFLILIALGERERHGYGLVKAIETRAPGTRIEPANLYRTLRTMKREGLIAESSRRPDPELDDSRRRYFRITEKGARLVRAEAERLSKLVRAAKKLRPLEN
jgi:DNA-binding PadR family transcriptional regulator